MAGEFVRTPKRGLHAGRYSQRAQWPLLEILLSVISCASFGVALTTAHWFAAPFAGLFAFGYGYVALLVVREQWIQRKAVQADSGSVDELPERMPAVRAA